MRKLAARKQTLAASAAVLLITTAGCATSSDDLLVKRGSDGPAVTVSIWPTGVAPALGYYALVRQGDAICAVKFTETAQSKDPERKYRYAVYEWHYQPDGSGEFSRPSAKHGEGKATWNYTEMVGRLSFQTGNVGVDCGDIKLAWAGGTTLSFRAARKDETEKETIKRGIMIAPTKWTEINQVNARDKRLTWYGYDPSRKDKSTLVQALY
jgi:hypothetical protein